MMKGKRSPSDRQGLKKLFKFRSFTERLANIRISTAHLVRKRVEEAPEEKATFFNESLQKWKELNCTLDFVSFHKEIHQKVQTLAQLLYHKNEVIDKLQGALSVKDTLAYEPLLDLLVQLARDLLEEFYPHFKDFFLVLVKMCETQNAELIQCVFNTFAYLFKFLWRYMLKDLENVFRLYSELLHGSQKAHIRQFAVESFAFLLRKVRNQEALVDMIFGSLWEEPELREGVGQLMFEMCRGVSHQFHSCCETFLPLLLQKMDISTSQRRGSSCEGVSVSEELEREGEGEGGGGTVVFDAVGKMVELMADHTRKEFAQPLWKPLLNHLGLVWRQWKEGGAESGCGLVQPLVSALHLVGVVTSWRKGSRICNRAHLFQTLSSLLHDTTPPLPAEAFEMALHLAASLILVSQDLQAHRELAMGVVKGVACGGRGVGGEEKEVEMVLGFFQELAKNVEIFVEDFLEHCIGYCEAVLAHKKSADNQSSTLILKFLTELCLLCDPRTLNDATTCMTPSTGFTFDFSPLCNQPSKQVLRRRTLRNSKRALPAEGGSAVAGMLAETLGQGLQVLKGGVVEWEESEELMSLWCSLVCLQYARPPQSEILPKLLEVLGALERSLQDTRHHQDKQDGNYQDIRQKDSKQQDMKELIVSQTLLAIVGVTGDEMGVAIPLERALDILKLLPSSLPVLASLLHYLTVLSAAEDAPPLSSEHLHQLLPCLSLNLSSSSSAVRLLTLQILCLFEPLQTVVVEEEEEGDGEEMTRIMNVLEMCKRAEEIPTSLESYRDKIMWLQKLDYNSSLINQLPPEFKEIPLRYLLGVLYINFSVLWEPIIEVISSHAVTGNKKPFWGVFGKILEEASTILESPGSISLYVSSNHDESAPWHKSIPALFWNQTGLLTGRECRRPDYGNYRMQLWKCVSKLSLEMTESRSRILVPILFRFIEKEYSLREDSLQTYQNLLKCEDEPERGGARGGEREGLEEQEEEEEEEETVGEKVAPSQTQRSKKKKGNLQKGAAQDGGYHITRRNLTQTLLSMLQVFTKFHSPKSCYKQEELWQLYLKLCTHKESDVQSLALAGLLTFKPPYLLPYKENFERLLEDTSFREELVSFRVDSEGAVVSDEHREKLLPVLMRILYGRMQRQGGHSTTKGGGAGRRGLVLRFLGGCEGNELTEFVQLLTLPFRDILKGGGVPCKGVDPGHVIPLKQQQGFLNMAGQMITILGPKLLPHLPGVLTIVTTLGAACAHLLDVRDKIQPHLVNALKALRQLCFARITQCFQKFTDFNFAPLRQNLLDSFVYPQLPKLAQENLQSPTPLLKLLHTWAAHPQYWYFLAQNCKDCATTGPSQATPTASLPNGAQQNGERGGADCILGRVFDCLASPKTSPSVCECVMEIAVHLLTLGGEEEGGGTEGATGIEGGEGAEGVAEEAGGLRTQEAKTMDTEMMETDEDEGERGREAVPRVKGEELVGPYVPRVLEYLSRVIGGMVGRGGKLVGRGRERNLENEFVVLSRVSCFVSDPGESCTLIKLLLPFLLHPSQHYKKHEASILESIWNLVLKPTSVTPFIRPLAQLFGVLSERASRTKLCAIFQRIAEKYAEWNLMSGIVDKLNSWDRKLLNEPDYDLRLEGFAEAKQVLLVAKTAADSGCGQADAKEGVGGRWTSSHLDQAFPPFQTALFYLLQCADMSIRDAAASFVSELVKAVTPEDDEAFQLLILSSCVTIIKHGLRSKLDFARHEALDLLSTLVRTFPQHPKFSDLAPLCHSDPEADFFMNVHHIQLHRRTRAFRKLAKVCSDEGEGVGQTNCLSFLLPLANQIVFSPTTNTEMNLVSEAVGVVGAIARRLTWGNYSFILGHYLRQLAKSREHQKNLIKVVITVLDNFHFDLSTVSACEEDGGSHGNSDDKEEEGTAEAEEKDAVPLGEEGEELEGEGEGRDVKDTDDERSKALAMKIYRNIVKTILPNLQQVLTKKIDTAGHKLSQQEEDVDSEVLRVPVAMAMTKLLQALPEEQLHANLPNLLLKVCLTLKNRSRDVRDVGRTTLVKMAASLGPKYLKYIIKEMKESLTRGYMLHVLSYSLHYLLRALTTHPSTTPSSASSPLAVGDLDPCLELVSEVLIEDLFGGPAEERESGENVAKIPESKTPQSYNSYEIVSQYLSPKLLPDLLSPVKEVLETRSTSRSFRVVEEVFRRVAVGIQGNQGFTPQALLVFIHEVLSDSIPQLSLKKKPKQLKIADPKARPPDSRLLPPAPGRSGPRPISLGNTGASIVTEFGLQLFHVSLKHGKFDTSDEAQLSMLDPFVPLLSSSLSSPHVKVLCRTVHCLVWLLRLPLPSLGTHIQEICGLLFGLLRKYARAGMGAGNNRELVLSAFKAMTVLVRDCRRHDITEEELKILLTFVEEDIQDYQRQGTAFPLLKAILSRKLVVEEIYDIMFKVAGLSLTSDSEHVRLQCRQAVLQFLMDYPLGKKLNKFLDFHITNLSYEEQSGRESMLEQFNAVFTKFPPRLLNRHSAYFFVPLSLCLLKEESPLCRQMVAATIKTLLGRLDKERSNEIALIIETWISDDTNLTHIKLGVQVLGLMVEAEGQGFVRRLPTFLPLLHACLRRCKDGMGVVRGVALEGGEEGKEEEPGEGEKGEEMETQDGGTEGEEERVRLVDQTLFSSLSTFSKIFQHCDIISASSTPLPAADMHAIWEDICSLLLHPHAWVRLQSSQLLGLLFASHSPDDLAAAAAGGGGTEGCGHISKPRKKKRGRRKEVPEEGGGVMEGGGSHYLMLDTVHKAQKLSGVSCAQLSSPLLTSELANQVVKNLVFLAKVLHRLQLLAKLGPSGDQGEELPAKKRQRLLINEDRDIDRAKAFESRTLCPEASSNGEEEQEVVGGDGEGEGPGEEEAEIEGMERGEMRRKDLKWLMKRISRLASYEAGHSPKESIKRTHVFQWIAAVSLDLSAEHLPSYLPFLLPPLHRELADPTHTAGKDLFSLAQEVLDLIKGVCGKEEFSKAYAQHQKAVAMARTRRRGQAALEAVMDPERSLLRKKRKNELKRESRKRQILVLRPDATAATKRRKRI